MQESDFEFGVAHDRWLADYESGIEIVWCSNKECEFHSSGMQVEWEKENGQSWWNPEECPRCHGAWVQERPEEEEVLSESRQGSDEIG